MRWWRCVDAGDGEAAVVEQGRRLKGGGGGARSATAGVALAVVMLVSLVGARGGGGTRLCCGGRSPSSIFLEQPLQREFTPFFLQMMARVCEGGGVGSFPLLLSPKWTERGKGPLEAHNPKPKILIENKKVQKEEGIHEKGPKKGRTHPKA